LCYLAFNKTIGPQKGELLRDILPGRQVPKPIFDCGGQGGRIISVAIFKSMRLPGIVIDHEKITD
jgi:hypothetical protein